MIFTENRYDRSIERMMKGIPNFYPRSSGIVVTGRFQYTAEMCDCKLCSEYIPKKGCGVPHCVCLAALSIALQMGFGILISVGFLLFHRPLLALIGTDGQLLDFAGQYLSIVGGTIFLQALMTAVSVIIRNHGLTKITMYVSAGINLFNTAADLVLVPSMGVTGAAIATCAGRLIGCVLLTVILFAKVEKPSAFRALVPFPFRQLGMMLKVGIPSATETFLYNLSQLVITAIVLNCLSENELIAKTYVQSITMLFYVIYLKKKKGVILTDFYCCLFLP